MKAVSVVSVPFFFGRRDLAVSSQAQMHPHESMRAEASGRGQAVEGPGSLLFLMLEAEG